VYSSPSGSADSPDYSDKDEYRADDEVPVVLRGREIGRISAAELLPG